MEIVVTIIIMGILIWGLWSIGNSSDKLIESWKR